MANKVVPPSLGAPSFSCPRCDALASQSWFSLFASGVDKPFIATHELLAEFRSKAAIEPFEASNRTVLDRQVIILQRALEKDVLKTSFSGQFCSEELMNLHISECYSCKKLTLWRYDTILYPSKLYEIEPNSDLNDDIRADFNEARSILDLSPRGAAALLRLCVQKLCKQLGKPGNNINNDIASLVQDGLSPKIQQALDVVRVIGNNSVHPGELDLRDDRETASSLFRIINTIADDRITHPNSIAALYESFPKSIKDQIEKRDAKKT